jgi:hypothetical protein
MRLLTGLVAMSLECAQVDRVRGAARRAADPKELIAREVLLDVDHEPHLRMNGA